MKAKPIKYWILTARTRPITSDVLEHVVSQGWRIVSVDWSRNHIHPDDAIASVLLENNQNEPR